ncbi:MAG TPA: hypothetical protein VFP10_13515 [Candidatus Eisenbacteria bacterium]|nr:hypothetical protein [Candidatus Eisenbacteria bacterium]
MKPIEPSGKRHRDGWEKLQIVLQPVGGLLTAAAIALFGFVTSNKLDARQAIETNTRLYSELMSKREESESALRKDMFVNIISSFLHTGGSDLNSDVLNLELLAYNFHESLNLKPLFLDLKRRITLGALTAKSPEAQLEYTSYAERLERVAREIARRQMIVLEGAGRKYDSTVDLSQDPEGTSLDPVTLTLEGRDTSLGLDILSVNRADREITVSMNVETPDPELGRQTKTMTFNVSYFDFPMIDNIRLAYGQRAAVVLNNFSEQSADLTVVLFPGTYASLKERPYYNEVIENVLGASARPGP